MIAGEALRYKSIPTSVLFSQRPGAYFRSTYQSLTCLILFLHLRLKCFTLPPSGADLGLLGRERAGGRGGVGWGGESRGQLLWFVRNTSFHGELGEEGGRREPERVIMQPAGCRCERKGRVCLLLRKCARLIENGCCKIIIAFGKREKKKKKKC